MGDVALGVLDAKIRGILDDPTLSRLTIVEWGAIVNRRPDTLRRWIRKCRRKGIKGLDILYGRGRTGFSLSRATAGEITRRMLLYGAPPISVLRPGKRDAKGRYVKDEKRKGKKNEAD